MIFFNVFNILCLLYLIFNNIAKLSKNGNNVKYLGTGEIMKRIILLVTVLFITVVSTACVNNLAIQELNNKAQEYMEKGDPDSAICRLEASLDLDDSVFETRYNLGIAYLNAKKFDKAVETLRKATELNPDFVDTYYSLAVAVDELNYIDIDKIKNPQNYVDESETPVLTEDSTIVEQNDKKTLSDEEKAVITQKVEESIEAYNNYLEKNPNAKEKESIENRISSLKAELDFEQNIQ